MFGLVAQVSLWGKDNSKNPHIIRFAENEQSGDNSNSARIKFHTIKQKHTGNWETAEIVIYNMNRKLWDWIESFGNKLATHELKSNLYIKLEVGWSDFGNSKTLYPIFTGNVNSFYCNREGCDNLFHFFCGMLPSVDSRKPIKRIESVPASTIDNKFGQTRRQILTDLFIEYLYETRLVEDTLDLSQSLSFEAVKDMFGITGKLKAKITAPQPNDNVLSLPERGIYQDTNTITWLDTKILRCIGGYGSAKQRLDDFCAMEGCTYDRPIVTGTTFELPIYLEKKQKVSQSGVNTNRGGRKTRVPDSNIFVNYEMLVEDPRPIGSGLEIVSLMRPWIFLGSLIMLKIDTKLSPRSEVEYTSVPGTSTSNYNLQVWGTRNRVQQMNNNLKEELKTRSFFNVPLQVNCVEHMGDTHSNEWYSRFQTFQPGWEFLV